MKKASVFSVLSAILLTWAVTVGAIFCPITAFRIPAEPLTLFLFSGALAILFSILLALRRGWIGLGLPVCRSGGVRGRPVGGYCQRLLRGG